MALGDLVENINDYFDREGDLAARYVAGEHVDERRIGIRRWGMTDDGFFPPTFKRKFRAGDVLFHSRNIKKVAVPDFDGVTGEKLFVLRSKDQSALMQEFLGYLLSSETFYTYAERNWSGSVNKFFNWKPLSRYEFLLPPIQEQARRVEVLRQSEALWERLRDAIHSATVLRNSVFVNAIASQTIEHEEIKGLAKFSSGKLIQVSNLPKVQDQDHSIPVIGGNGLAAYTTMPLPEAPNPCIAIGRVGEYCGAVHFIPEPCWVSDNALFVKSHSDQLRTRFLELCLRSLHLNKHSTGGAQPLMTQAIINELKMPVPELHHQDQIIATDAELEKACDALSDRGRAAEEIKRQLLQECFSS